MLWRICNTLFSSVCKVPPATVDNIHFDRRPLAYGHLPMVENKCENEPNTGNPFRTDLEYKGYDKC